MSSLAVQNSEGKTASHIPSTQEQDLTVRDLYRLVERSAPRPAANEDLVDTNGPWVLFSRELNPRGQTQAQQQAALPSFADATFVIFTRHATLGTALPDSFGFAPTRQFSFGPPTTTPT